MTNKEIPFRPKLEGDFRVRFYNVVSEFTEGISSLDIDKVAKKEIDWVENECTFNLSQRKRYRAVWFLFRDLIRASWKVCYREGVLYMRLPNMDNTDVHDASSPEAKKFLRSWMDDSRHERLLIYSDFIQRMERKNSCGHDISELIADGEELSRRLEGTRKGDTNLLNVVKPYMQLVVEGERDEYTGIKTSDIWRYFRLTWSTPAETTPGRTIQYLIRDAAHPMHAVMGIISLENCAVQITDRDNYIGWNPKAFIDKLNSLNIDDVKKEFKRLLEYIEKGICAINYIGLCSEDVVENPTDVSIRRLFDYASSAESRRQRLLKEAQEKGISNENKSELGSISKDTEEALYSRKRAEQLARLLASKKEIMELYNSDRFTEEWSNFCKSDNGYSAIRNALVAQKTQHIGSSMMELNVCGAIPPYNEILGGKLAALLAISPQVAYDYKERYSQKPSMIASRLKGEDVCRPADLVYVGTSSLYYVGSSQYNRLKIPKVVFNSKFDLEWKKVGMTIGYGTMHISKATTQCLTEAISDGYNKINHVFGEGASPKMRLLSSSIRELLESSNDETSDFSKHAMSRIVYGACLASNTLDYLNGKAEAPEYYTDFTKYKEETQKIIDFWSTRWLGSRLNYEPIFERISKFDKVAFLVGNQIDAENEWSFKKLEEVTHMPVNDKSKIGLQFIRDFYRGTSAYADHVDENLLSQFHIKTQLDEAIYQATKKGMDVVLTGNPGDGKTHIIRMLSKRLEGCTNSPVIELDASTLSDDQIYHKWEKARNEGRPFIIAINAAVLYSVYNSYSDFEPIKDAYIQMAKSVVYHGEDIHSNSVVVFDLSKRDILTKEIVEQAISKMTSEKYYQECETCNLKDDCVVKRNRILLQDPLFQERLDIIFHRVSLQGYHATLRELQSFISFLIFGDRSCKELNRTSGDSDHDLVNLIYSGKGKFFEAIKQNFDPIRVSHPTWDEKILSNEIEDSSWSNDYKVSAETISFDNIKLFNLRKRQFYFFNSYGVNLINILDDDVAKFQDFLNQDDKKTIKGLIGLLNNFFGSSVDSKGNKSIFQIWLGHRYNNDTRSVLISSSMIERKDFSIGRPSLLRNMQEGIDMAKNYVRLEKKTDPDIYLKIDFDMYLLLNKVEKGVPVLFIESNQVKKVWRFVEQLHSSIDNDEDSIQIDLLDVKNKHTITVDIDLDEKKYVTIDSEKKKGM